VSNQRFSHNEETLKQIAQDILQRAGEGGASACETDVSDGFGQSVTVRCGEVETIEYNRDKGVVVTEVKPDSPAAQAGLAPGDVIREVNRMPVQELQDVERGLSRGRDPGQVLLRVEREGSQRYIVIATG